MRQTETALDAAVVSAGEELARRRARFEVFARLGESTHLVRDPDGVWRQRHTREVGVACRVARGGEVGFAAAAGSGAKAGREAAQAALGGLLPGADPLPPRQVLGTVSTPPPALRPDPQRQTAFAQELASDLDGSGVRLVQLRTLIGTSATVLATGEGYLARADATGSVVELLLAPPSGPWRHFHFAARDLAEFDPLPLAARAREAALLAVRGSQPPRALADVVLAPAVAAPLVVALAEHVASGGCSLPAGTRPTRVRRAWHLVDERAGPGGLLPLPCDGEGLPARRIELLGQGRIGERLATWADAQRNGLTPGGAVRPSYRHPPTAGPANLVVLATAGTSPQELLNELADGCYLALPAGSVRLDAGSDRFAMRAAAVVIRQGRAVAAHPLVELRGSFRRLLAGLEAVGDDPASFSLTCAVTTPSLLFRRLEIA
ncbi:MAG: metallopeptidase TldD-related protein [Thermoanaerobaculales bacterium]